MKKFLISLKKDQQRRDLFFSQPDTADFEIFDAINTMNSSEDELRHCGFDFTGFEQAYGRKATKGEIGCTLSHLGVYEKILQDQNIQETDYVLVCEDDALLAQNFEKNITALLYAENDADIIWVGQSKIAEFNDVDLEINYPSTFSFLQKKIGDTQYSLSYPYKNYFAGTVAYLIKKSACRRFVEQQKQFHWLADDFIYFEKQFALDIKMVRPLMVIENPTLASNLQALRGSLNNNLVKKLLKYPLKKLFAIKRNL